MNLLLLSRRKTLCCSQYCRVTSLILKTSGLDFYYCDLLQCISVLAVTRRGWKDFLLLFHAVSRKTPTGCYTGCAARARENRCVRCSRKFSVYDCLPEDCLGYGPFVTFLVCRLRENSLALLLPV